IIFTSCLFRQDASAIQCICKLPWLVSFGSFLKYRGISIFRFNLLMTICDWSRCDVTAGHACWDDHDVINGKPTGAVRVSFGYMSTYEEAN
ncbi:hypothetical protein S245_055026, partial [Arachis hypogaea]